MQLVVVRMNFIALLKSVPIVIILSNSAGIRRRVGVKSSELLCDVFQLILERMFAQRYPGNNLLMDCEIYIPLVDKRV
jgi:hypothetical protein